MLSPRGENSHNPARLTRTAAFAAGRCALACTLLPGLVFAQAPLIRLAEADAPGIRFDDDASAAAELRTYLVTGAGTDSSIASATELGVSALPLGDLRLVPEAGKVGDAFTTLGAGLAYLKPLDADSVLRIRTEYRADDGYSTDAFDIGRLSGALDYAHPLGELQLSYGAKGQLLEIGDKEFLRSGSLITTLRRNTGEGWSQALSGAWTLLRYNDAAVPETGSRDASQWQVSGELGRSSGNFNHSLSLYYGGEQGKDGSLDESSRNFYGLAFSEQFRFRPGHIPYVRVSLHYRENRDPQVPAAGAVENNSISTSMGWIWQANRNINVTTDLTYTDNESSLESFRYERVRLQTGLRYEF